MGASAAGGAAAAAGASAANAASSGGSNCEITGPTEIVLGIVLLLALVVIGLLFAMLIADMWRSR